MTQPFHLDSEKHLVTTKLSDLHNVDDFMRHAEAVQALFDEGTLDETWMQLFYCDKTTFKGKYPATIVRQLAKINPWPENCTRVLVTDNKFVFALCRMYQQLTSHGKNRIQVLPTLEKAEAYLEQCRQEQ